MRPLDGMLDAAKIRVCPVLYSNVADCLLVAIPPCRPGWLRKKNYFGGTRSDAATGISLGPGGPTGIGPLRECSDQQTEANCERWAFALEVQEMKVSRSCALTIAEFNSPLLSEDRAVKTHTGTARKLRAYW